MQHRHSSNIVEAEVVVHQSTAMAMAVSNMLRNGVLFTLVSIVVADASMSWEATQNLFIAIAFTVGAGSVIFLAALIWSICRCQQGRCVPGDVRPSTELCLGVVTTIAAVLTFTAAGVFVYYGIFVLGDEFDILETNTLPVKQWYPTVNSTIQSIETSIQGMVVSSQAFDLGDAAYTTQIIQNLTNCRASLRQLDADVAAAHTGKFVELTEELTSRKDDTFFPLCIAYTALACCVAMCAMINVWIRKSCFCTNYYKERPKTDHVSVVVAVTCATFAILLLWIGATLMHLVVTNVDGFCDNFNQAVLDELGTDNTTSYTKYYLYCRNATERSNPYTSTFRSVQTQMFMAQNVLLDVSAFNASDVTALNKTMVTTLNLIGAIPNKGPRVTSDLGGQISCLPLSNHLPKVQEALCDNIQSDAFEIAYYIALAMAVLASISFFVSARMPIMDVNMHAVRDSTFVDIQNPFFELEASDSSRWAVSYPKLARTPSINDSIHTPTRRDTTFRPTEFSKNDTL
eukprot:m.61023 g.61023  ORF g.61023 m.61023 type:complete len:515 (+) comp22920_c0_seq2:173-1717(+)